MDLFIFVSQQWLLITLLAALIGVFFLTEQGKSGKSLSTSELVRLINNDEAVVIDLRSTAEFEAGHIHGALSIPHQKLASRIAELEKHRDKIIVVADKIGQHSSAAGKKLNSAEFNVRRLGGGISEWQGSSLPLVKGK